MFRFFTRAVVFLVLVVAATIVLMRFTVVPQPFLAPAETLARTILAPVNSGLMTVVHKVEDLSGMMGSIREMQQDKAELEKELGLLRQENNMLKEYQLEAIRLRNLLGFKESTLKQFELMAATVIGRNPSNWYSSLTIDRGSEDGVRPDMVVIVPDGLVGRVAKVTPTTAEVTLIVDLDAAVGCISQTIHQTPGVVVGNDGGRGDLKMIHIPYDAVIAKGDTIVSSGLGGLYPRGLRLGRVTAVENEQDGFLKNAIVEPFVDFDRLQEVFLITRVYDVNPPEQAE